MRDEALDLLMGSTCVGCAAPGRLLCPGCRASLPSRATVSWPSPTPPGLVTPWACAAYDGVARALVLGHKDAGLWGLGRTLGRLLAVSVAAAADAGHQPHPALLLVPVPSRPGAARRRGHDPTGAMVSAAAHTLRAGGHRVRVADLLRSDRRVRDQAGLDATARGANLAGVMWVPGTGLRRLARRAEPVRVVLCDDVLTTGATAREGQRALAAVGLAPSAIAVVAATRRRSGAELGTSLP